MTEATDWRWLIDILIKRSDIGASSQPSPQKQNNLDQCLDREEQDNDDDDGWEYEYDESQTEVRRPSVDYSHSRHTDDMYRLSTSTLTSTHQDGEVPSETSLLVKSRP